MAQYALEAGVSWLGAAIGAVASGSWQVAKWGHRRIWQQADEETEVVHDASPLAQMFDDREREFHNYVRKQIICMWLFMLLYLFAYWVISKLKRKTEREALYAGEEDYFVYRVSVWISSTATATSIGSLTLLPFSVIGVELLQLYEGNYYLQWLSYPLIGSLWHYVFMLSNLSLFVLLPFSYFFIESQGFSTRKLGVITERVYEAMAISFLFAFVLLCLAEVVLKILDWPVSFLSITYVNLPLIYSCVSFTGALLLLISTPYGFARMFSLIRDVFREEEVEIEQDPKIPDAIIEDPMALEQCDFHQEDLDPELRKDSDSGIESGSIEEMHRLEDTEDSEGEEEAGEVELGCGDVATPSVIRRRHPFLKFKHNYGESPPKWKEPERKFVPNPDYDYRNLSSYVESVRRQRSSFSESDDWLGSSRTFSSSYYQKQPEIEPDDANLGGPLTTDRRTKSEEALNTWKPLEHVKKTELYRKAVEERGRLVKVMRRMRLPVVGTLFLVLTTCSLIMVAINTLKLLFGYRSLPVYVQYYEVTTRHSFGLFGACMETVTIIYVMITSFVGLYNLPILRSLRPVHADTPMPTIIINSSIILVVSSALPVIVNTVGLTTFDLLGAHSSLQWLGSFKVVVSYNTLFFMLSVVFLFNQLTASMRKTIWKWICHLRCRRQVEDVDETQVMIGGEERRKE
ncbi:unnamed protein product [Caenorhabditis sp. 36 PRJEB53466]|nr:unnamed protein product [Caenorhabditis sp. 36 PRJEB53466]